MSKRMLTPATQSIHYRHGHLMLAPAVVGRTIALDRSRRQCNSAALRRPQQRGVFAIAAGNEALRHAALRQPTATECIRHSRRQ